MRKRMAVILAAGKGTRMKSKLYKVLHPILGLSMIEHVMRAVQGSQVDQIVTIVGHGAEAVQGLLGDRSDYAIQAEQLGTGHAVLQAKNLMDKQVGSCLVICGDTPLLTAETLEALFDYHEAEDAKATILTAQVDDPKGYGRVIRQADGHVSHIVEDKDANSEEKQVKEINTGTYIFDNQLLFELLGQVKNDNTQGEYYLPDVIGLLKERGEKILAHVMEHPEEAIGVNDRVALAEAGRLMRNRINRHHLMNGVTLVDPLSTYIEADVQIASDTLLEAGVSLKGKTVIGQDCFIGAHSEIVDSVLADQVLVRQSVIENSQIGKGSDVGPFAHLRPNSQLGQSVHIGNFVEVKNSVIGDNTKSGHLTYIGDAKLGQGINIGCGTIFVNYDGKHKHQTIVGDNSFIGCDTKLMSPLTLGKEVVTAAGSTITDDIPDQGLGIARQRQTTIPNYYPKFINK